MWFNFLQKMVRWLDPKLEKYRHHSKQETKTYTPKTIEDLIGVIARAPKTVLSSSDRAKIAAAMSFDNRIVYDLMLPKSEMVFVRKDEILGPLVLDKLYKSGFTIFPVIDNKDKVLGVIHTDALNALEIKSTERAEKYLDPNFSHLNTTDSLEDVIEKIKQTNHFYYLVLDKNNSLAGFLTIPMLLDYFLGKN